MKPFLQGRKVLETPALPKPVAKVSPVTLPAVSNPSVHHSHQGGGHGPAVEVIKEGDKVVRLIVICSCGEKTEIECLYTAGH